LRTIGLTRTSIFLGMFPALLLYVSFVILPIFISVYYSFYDWNGLSAKVYIGFDNFKTIFSEANFWLSVKNTFIVAFLMVVIQLPLGLGLALLLNQPLKGIKFFRTIGFLPVVISSVIVSLTWGMIYNSQYGFLNGILHYIGLQFLIKDWLGDATLSIFSVCVTIIWQGFGMYMIIYLAALQNVSSEVLEAAEVDGATGLQQIIKVIIPIIKPTIVVTIIYSISNSFRVFDLIYVMTKGGPAHSTEVMTIYMYQNTFQNLKFGYGSAISLLILLFSFIIITITTKMLQRND
jgi:raffinose/stachyose/melibiose transport system permease protein